MSPVEHFIPDSEPGGSAHVIAAYIEASTQPGDLILDPFCQSATVVQQALGAGRRAIAVSFHSLDALRTRLAVTSIPGRQLDAAVTRLADSPKQNTTLREHLDRLYQTACRTCSKPVVADHFIWERDDVVPKQVHCTCPTCGDARMHDCDPADVQALKAIEARGLHYWYLLDRVAQEADPGRKFAADLLELYTPRNLYVLSNLVMRIDDLFANTPVHDFLRLALLRCLEWGSKLNPVPDEPVPSHRARLRVPPRFVERNVWRLFEETTRQLAQSMPTSPVSLAGSVGEVVAPSATPDGGLAKAFVGHLSVRQLAKDLPPGSVRLVYTQPPDRGREHWAMPYLWTGFLYGHDQAALLWPLARRRSSDWPWYLSAMRGALAALQKATSAGGHIVFVGPEKGLSFYEVLCVAAAGASLRTQSALYHCSEAELATQPFAGLSGEYRITWTPGASAPPWPMPFEEIAARLQRTVVEVAGETLQQRAEPCSFVRLHCQIWAALGQQGVLQRLLASQELADALQYVRGQIRAVLQREIGLTFTQIMDSEDDSHCWWWLCQPPQGAPLSERVEQVALETLTAAGPIDAPTFLGQVYQRFPGPQTPDREWTLACLASCAQKTASGQWVLRPEEGREQRSAARGAQVLSFSDLGQRVGCQVRTDAEGWDVEWTQGGKRLAGFVVLDSAALSRLLTLASDEGEAPQHKIAAISATRRELIELRLLRSVWLRKRLVEQGWRFVLDSDLEKWAGQTQVSLAHLSALAGLDWLSARDRTQLPLI